MNLALHNAKNVIEYYQKRGEDTVIEIVAYSGGLHMLRSDTSLVKDRIKEMVGNDATRNSRLATTQFREWKSVKVTPFLSSWRPSLFRQGSWNLLNFKSKDGAVYAHDPLRRRRRGDRIRAGLLHLLRSVPARLRRSHQRFECRLTGVKRSRGPAAVNGRVCPKADSRSITWTLVHGRLTQRWWRAGKGAVGLRAASTLRREPIFSGRTNPIYDLPPV
jgi:hypothetical protein